MARTSRAMTMGKRSKPSSKHLISWDFMAVSEMCASRRHKAGHDTVDMTLPPPGCFSAYTDWLARGTAGSAPSRLSLMQSGRPALDRTFPFEHPRVGRLAEPAD